MRFVNMHIAAPGPIMGRPSLARERDPWVTIADPTLMARLGLEIDAKPFLKYLEDGSSALALGKEKYLEPSHLPAPSP